MKAKMLFGTAGVPHSSGGPDSISGIERVSALRLDAMELEFVRGVHMSEGTAHSVGNAARDNNVMLRVHAPYFINLNSAEKKKIEASKKRIFDSARIGEICGAKIVTFHPAYYGGSGREECMRAVESAVNDILGGMEKEKMNIRLAPETTGKGSQFGSLSETLELCRRIPEIMPMVDFSHLHARENGRFKTKRDFAEAINEIKKSNRKFLENLQMHVSGINFSAKGERNHMNMQEIGNSFNYKWLLEALRGENASGCIICESPNLEEDALLMKKYWEKL